VKGWLVAAPTEGIRSPQVLNSHSKAQSRGPDGGGSIRARIEKTLPGPPMQMAGPVCGVGLGI